MTAQNQPQKVQAEKKSQRKAEVPSVEFGEELAGLERLPGGPMLGFGGGSAEDQARRLGDMRLQGAQRRALARQIGRTQGNLHLQRVVQRLTQDEPGESHRTIEEQETYPVASHSDTAVQRQPLAGRIGRTQGNLHLQRVVSPVQPGSGVEHRQAVRVKQAMPEGRVALSRVRRIDQSGAGFWGQLENAVSGELSNWLANRHGAAISTFGVDMQARSEQGVGRFVLSNFSTLVGLIPGYGSIASGVISISMSVYDFARRGTPFSLEDFLDQARRAQATISRQITSGSHALFRTIRSARDAETDANRATVRKRTASEVDAALDNLPSYERTLRSLTIDWVNSSRDSWDLGDWGGMTAGNIYVGMDYWTHTGGFAWGLHGKPFIDDVPRPEGTIIALKHAFGEGTFLHHLPFQMNVEITRCMIMERRRELGTDRFIKPRSSSMTVPSPSTWQYVSGSRSSMSRWASYRNKPRIRDLVSD